MSTVATLQGDSEELTDPSAASRRRRSDYGSHIAEGALGSARCLDVMPEGAGDRFDDELAERLREGFAGEDEMPEEGEERISKITERSPGYSEFPSEFPAGEPRTGVMRKTLHVPENEEERVRREQESVHEEVEMEGRRRRAETRVCVLRPRPNA